MTQHSLAAESDSRDVSEEMPMTHDLHITAASVTIIDRSGVRVPVGSLSSVIRVLADRKHKRPPVITVASAHTAEPTTVFQTGKWTLTEGTFKRYTGERTPTYILEYADFIVSIPGHGEARTKSSTLAPVLTAARKYADTTGSLIVLDSDLPGFTSTVISPRDAPTTNEALVDEDDAPTEAMALIPPKPDFPPPSPEDASATAVDILSPSPRRTRARTSRRVPLSLHISLARRHLGHLSTAVTAHVRRLPQHLPRARTGSEAPTKKRILALTSAASVVALTAAGGVALIATNAPTPDPEPTTAAAPAITPSERDLLAGYTEAWTLPAAEAEAVSWFAAGVAHVSPDSGEFILTDPTSGEEIAAVDLDGAIDYTAEFTDNGTPAVGARTDEGFTALTAEGDTQSWPLTDDDVLRVSGTTPMLIRDGDAFALTVDENDPIPVTGNPELRPAAIDGDDFLQIAAGQPRLATLSRSGDKDATETTLAPPTPTARFDRHLTVGHGLALTQWSDGSSTTLVIHDTDTGDVTATVATPDDVSGWSLGRGMQTLVVGDHTLDASTGHVLAATDGAPFATAIGPAAVIDNGSQRHYIVGGHSFTTQAGRVLGYDGEGLAVVRNTDGSVTTMILDPEETS